MGTAAIKNLKAILFTHQIITMPMVIWLMVSFFESIPATNQFLFSLILSGPKTKTVPVAVYNFISYGKIDWAGIGAAATLIVLPVSVFAFFVRKSIVQGLTMGALKD